MTKKEPKKVKKLAIIRNSAAFSAASLSQSITEFENSERFELLKTFSLSKTIQLPINEKNKDLTFQEFTELGAKSFLTKYKPDKDTLERLLVFLKESSAIQKKNIIQPIISSTVADNQSFESIHKKTVFNMEGLPSVDIINARQVLTSAISKLKSASQFESIQEKTLEQFWETNWPRAPFEEALTLKQISELNVDSLLKKRSLVPAKVAAIAGAIAKATRATKSPVESEKTLQSNKNNKKSFSSHALELVSIWQDYDLVGLPSYAHSIINFYESQANQIKDSESLLSRILFELPKYVSAKDFVMLWFANEHSNTLLSEMLKIEVKTIETLLLSARHQVLVCLKENFSALNEHWHAVLSSTGLPIDQLIAIHSQNNIDKEFLNSLCVLLLKAFGARHPIIASVEFQELWTCNEEHSVIAFDLICAALPKSNFEVKRQFKTIFPYFEQAKLIKIFCTLADLNEKTDQWIRR